MPAKKTTKAANQSNDTTPSEGKAANGNSPDYLIYQSEPLGGDKTRLIQLGAAWMHQNGNGFNLKLDSTPIRGWDGSLVAFPFRERNGRG